MIITIANLENTNQIAQCVKVRHKISAVLFLKRHIAWNISPILSPILHHSNTTHDVFDVMVCTEYLFSSRSASHEMPCGHAIHWDCFRQLAAHDSRCPVCKKTAESKDRMMPTWRAMAAGIAMQPLPLELARVVDITCNDCEESHTGRAWHFLGVQCHSCSSFNTVVDRLVLSGEDAYRCIQANNRLVAAGSPLLPPLPLSTPTAASQATMAAAPTPRRTSPEGGETPTRPKRRHRRVNRRRSLL
jgi:Zinc-ribbon/Ring finger domain